MKLQPMVCPNCGGSIDRGRLICEYCGTKFDDGMRPIKIETYQHPVRHFQTQTYLPREFMVDNPDECAEYAIRDITKNLASHLKDMLELRTDFDPMCNQVVITARLRVLDPNYKF